MMDGKYSQSGNIHHLYILHLTPTYAEVMSALPVGLIVESAADESSRRIMYDVECKGDQRMRKMERLMIASAAYAILCTCSLQREDAARE